MNSFDYQMTQHQIAWRKANVRSEEWGLHKGRPCEWLLPPSLWEEGLWPGIRSGSQRSLPDYLTKNKIQRHRDTNNLKSSWVLCANLYFPFGEGEGLRLLAEFLRDHVHHDIESVEDVELEYAGSGDLHPSSLLGEYGGNRGSGQTSPDIAFRVNQGRGLVLTESKFVEHSFYPCSARSSASKADRPGNPDPTRCDNPLTVLADPAAQCHQAEWGRKYWVHLAPVIRGEKLASLRCCPAAHAGYQLFRQQALAEGIASSTKYDFVVSSIAVDARNETLRECLKESGIADIQQWGQLFDGKTHFAAFSHQHWVSWVRTRGNPELWADWLSYVDARYRFVPGRPASPELQGESNHLQTAGAEKEVTAVRKSSSKFPRLGPKTDLELAERVLFEEMEHAAELLQNQEDFGRSGVLHALHACHSFLHVRGLSGQALKPLIDVMKALKSVDKEILPELFDPKIKRGELSERKWSRSPAAREMKSLAAACMEALMKRDMPKDAAAARVARYAVRWPRVSKGMITASTVTNWRDEFLQASSKNAERRYFDGLSQMFSEGPKSQSYLEDALCIGPVLTAGVRKKLKSET